ncbi:MAG: CotH kinase family protein [Myxococcota bacterium]
MLVFLACEAGTPLVRPRREAAVDAIAGEGDPGDAPPDAPAVELFDPDVIPTLRLALPDGWEDTLVGMIPEDDCAPRDFLAGDLVFEDPATGVVEAWSDVGVRYRGHSSLWLPNYSDGNRWGFKLSFDAFVPGREFHGGLETLNLLGTEGDYTLAREVLALERLRGAGVPAPRAGWARVYVDEEYLGLFPLTEEADDGDYLARTFGAEGGSLYEVSGYCGNADLAWYGDDPETYDGFEPKAGTLEEDKRLDLIPLLACGSTPDDAAFEACLPARADVPGWLRLVAVEALLGNFDGLGAAGHNYLLWFPPDGSPAVVWPYDLDLAWFDNPLYIASESIFDFAPTWVPAAPALTRRMRRTWADDYCAAVLDAAWDPDDLDGRIEDVRAQLAPEIEADPFIEPAWWDDALDDLAHAAEERHELVVRQAEDCSPPG